jgi:hypothetical protein
MKWLIKWNDSGENAVITLLIPSGRITTPVKVYRGDPRVIFPQIMDEIEALKKCKPKRGT